MIKHKRKNKEIKIYKPAPTPVFCCIYGVEKKFTNFVTFSVVLSYNKVREQRDLADYCQRKLSLIFLKGVSFMETEKQGAKDKGKCTVVKITVTKKDMAYAIASKGRYLCDRKQVVEGEDYYSQASSPFFRYIYEQIENQRGGNENEKA
jgi:hypothetical protein